MFPFLRKYFSPFVRQNEELSLMQIFKPMYFLLSVVGLFPSAIKFLSGERERAIVSKSSSMNLAATIMFTAIICVFFGLHMHVLSVANKNNSFTKDPMTLANYSINLVFEIIVTVIVYICVFTSKKMYICILNEIAGCWADLPNNARSNVILGPLRVHVNCVVLGSLLLMLIVQLTNTFIQSVSNYNKVLVAITFNLPEMLLFTALAFYYVMIMMIVALLKNIEEHFAMIARMRMARAKEKDYVGLKFGSSLEALRQLRGVYGHTMAVKRHVNAAFQAPLLFILALSFHSLVCDAHGLYHIAAFHKGFTFTTLNVVVESFWVFYQVAKFYILGHASAVLELQANKVGRTLYDISADINKNIKSCNSLAGINKEIALHLEIQHIARMMKFLDSEITIYGLFPLKSSLLFSVVASATTYLVILVQFDGGQ